MFENFKKIAKIYPKMILYGSESLDLKVNSNDNNYWHGAILLNKGVCNNNLYNFSGYDLEEYHCY